MGFWAFLKGLFGGGECGCESGNETSSSSSAQCAAPSSPPRGAPSAAPPSAPPPKAADPGATERFCLTCNKATAGKITPRQQGIATAEFVCSECNKSTKILA